MSVGPFSDPWPNYDLRRLRPCNGMCSAGGSDLPSAVSSPLPSAPSDGTGQCPAPRRSLARGRQTARPERRSVGEPSADGMIMLMADGMMVMVDHPSVAGAAEIPPQGRSQPLDAAAGRSSSPRGVSHGIMGRMCPLPVRRPGKQDAILRPLPAWVRGPGPVSYRRAPHNGADRRIVGSPPLLCCVGERLHETAPGLRTGGGPLLRAGKLGRFRTEETGTAGPVVHPSLSPHQPSGCG